MKIQRTQHGLPPKYLCHSKHKPPPSAIFPALSCRPLSCLLTWSNSPSTVHLPSSSFHGKDLPSIRSLILVGSYPHPCLVIVAAEASSSSHSPGTGSFREQTVVELNAVSL